MSTIKIKKEKKEPSTAPKGMRDIIGDDYYDFQGFFEKAQEVAIYYGFKPIETPMLEHEDVFTSTIGEGTDIVDKEMYTLRTKGGDHLALRPEHTASLMRAYIEHGMQNQPQPVMFYQSGPVFRHDNPQAGRYRQFTQFDRRRPRFRQERHRRACHQKHRDYPRRSRRGEPLRRQSTRSLTRNAALVTSAN